LAEVHFSHVQVELLVLVIAADAQSLLSLLLKILAALLCGVVTCLPPRLPVSQLLVLCVVDVEVEEVLGVGVYAALIDGGLLPLALLVDLWLHAALQHAILAMSCLVLDVVLGLADAEDGGAADLGSACLELPETVHHVITSKISKLVLNPLQRQLVFLGLIVRRLIRIIGRGCRLRMVFAPMAVQIVSKLVILVVRRVVRVELIDGAVRGGVVVGEVVVLAHVIVPDVAIRGDGVALQFFR